jgi:capsular polysaccharide transport system permease protein
MLADELLDDALAELPPERPERRNPREPRGEVVHRLPNDIEIQDARLAIIERRKVRWRTIFRRTLIFALIPLVVVLLYLWLIATKLYQGEAIFTVQTSSQSAPSPTAGLLAIGGANSTIGDAFKAREFILSRPMMDDLEKRYGFMSHFASSEMDPLTRFRSPLGLNRDPYNYYLERVRVAVDVQEGILRLYVQARTPEDARRFGNAILASAEAHVNRFSDKISEDQISSLTRDVQNAEQQVADARRSLAVVQARRGELAPEQAATAVYQLISNLELQRAEAQRERDALLNQGLTDSPLLPRLTARVEELNSQISEQRRRLVNPGGDSLQRTLGEFENASARKQIAQARWESTLNTRQQAYLRILEQRRDFVVIVGMSVGTFPKVRDILPIAAPILLLLTFIYAAIFAIRRARLTSGRAERFRVTEVVRQWRR